MIKFRIFAPELEGCYDHCLAVSTIVEQRILNICTGEKLRIPQVSFMMLEATEYDLAEVCL